MVLLALTQGLIVAACIRGHLCLQRAGPGNLELLPGSRSLNALFPSPRWATRRAGRWGTLALCSPGRWRSGASATWTRMTSCWRRMRRWTWSTGCCSTSCGRGTGRRCRAAEGGPGRLWCGRASPEGYSALSTAPAGAAGKSPGGRELLAHAPPSPFPWLRGLCSPEP